MTLLLNCAVYTRKSSEEGLEQSFNSLEAQREAAEAYVASQRHEGWNLLPDAYDDGGYSGGNAERPALKRLLADVKAGKVQVVVVYKVDRLTRSLADFAKIIELFDQHKVSFVSVTQQFNTTTSMGRLTLNVLLSFAQFEREVTGERIRDKVAASKKKGMWMGGPVPYGYRVNNRRLEIVPEQSEQVRQIYSRYLACGSVRELCAELAIQGFNKGRGALYTMLKNPIYIGKIRHRKEIYPGQHEAIVDEAIWQEAQKLLQDHHVNPQVKGRARQHILTGLLFNADGDRLTPSSTNRHGKRYRYYIASEASRTKDVGLVTRLPAADIEELVTSHIEKQVEPDDRLTKARLSQLRHTDPAIQAEAIRYFVKSIIVDERAVKIELLGKPGETQLVPYRFILGGPQRCMELDGADPRAEEAAQRQLRDYIQGYVWREMYFDERRSIDQIAELAGIDARDVAKGINESFQKLETLSKIIHC